MDISIALSTSLDTPQQIALAESLGYSRAWCYDSPPLYPDVWMSLALAAERTSVIGLGPAVLVPHLRHVMTNAAAIATLEALAPGRVQVVVGAGFTGRRALGLKPTRWSDVREYVLALRSLLHGETIDWDDVDIKMLHRDGFAPQRPIDVPILIAAAGPKGFDVAAEVADGLVMGSRTEHTDDTSRFKRVVQMCNGTVLEPGEALDSERVLAAAGHGAAIVYHAAYESGFVEKLPRGAEFKQRVDALPARSRHLTTHEGHLVGLNSLDRDFIDAAAIARTGNALSTDGWRKRIVDTEAYGAHELVYQPAGDIEYELRAFAEMAGLKSR